LREQLWPIDFVSMEEEALVIDLTRSSIASLFGQYSSMRMQLTVCSLLPQGRRRRSLLQEVTTISIRPCHIVTTTIHASLAPSSSNFDIQAVELRKIETSDS
jgi:hypothetical protein